MKRIKSKIKKCHSFWKSDKNPITMWKRPKKLGDSILEDTEINRGFQDTEFSPKGFR